MEFPTITWLREDEEITGEFPGLIVNPNTALGNTKNYFALDLTQIDIDRHTTSTLQIKYIKNPHRSFSQKVHPVWVEYENKTIKKVLPASHVWIRNCHLMNRIEINCHSLEITNTLSFEKEKLVNEFVVKPTGNLRYFKSDWYRLYINKFMKMDYYEGWPPIITGETKSIIKDRMQNYHKHINIIRYNVPEIDCSEDKYLPNHPDFKVNFTTNIGLLGSKLDVSKAVISNLQSENFNCKSEISNCKLEISNCKLENFNLRNEIHELGFDMLELRKEIAYLRSRIFN